MGHFDISSCLHQLLRNSNLTWKFRHVKGHQDDIQDITNIDIWGQLNMVADIYAKISLWRYIEQEGKTFQMKQLNNAIPAIKVAYGGKDIYIASNLRKRLKLHLSQQRILQYWHDHNKQTMHDEFDVKVFKHAARNTPLHLRLWLSKWSCGICGVGKWLERWKDQNHSKCPRCLTDNETVEHVVHCQHTDATLCWNTGIEQIQE